MLPSIAIKDLNKMDAEEKNLKVCDNNLKGHCIGQKPVTTEAISSIVLGTVNMKFLSVFL